MVRKQAKAMLGTQTPNFVDKTIWTGDNLKILRGMNAECVDLIYLDPPFNSTCNSQKLRRERYAEANRKV